MKKLHVGKKLRKYFSFSKKVYLIPIISLIIGTVLGTASSLALSDDSAQLVREYLSNFFSVYTLQGVDRNEVFRISMYNNLKMLLILWVCSLSVFLIPVLAFYISVKGFKLGFAISFLIKSYSYTGAFLAFSSMLSQAFIIVPFIILFSGYGVNFAPQLRQLRERRMSADEKKRMFLSNLSALTVSLVVLILASSIDTYIVPFIFVPLS